MFDRILVAIDQNPGTAQEVFSEALALALTQQATLHILQVLYPLKSPYPDPLYLTLESSLSPVNTEAFGAYVSRWREVEQESLTQLKGYLETAQAAGVRALTSQRVGEPGREICALAQEWSADLILLGRRGMQGLGELLLGSVSNFVMHRANCAVLVVQGKVANPTL
ncbi:MAG: universal stress protein [Cyanobacteriota bacterium]|jgi:nucleotide-binding universal stress UspA family protein|nr:universal stress protein [Cyanobacteriota bacterium]